MSSARQIRRAMIYAGRALALAGIGVYRAVISPILTASMGPACRFEPTCSAYASAAIARHGAIGGGWMALRRLARCRPGGGWGYDPVADRSGSEMPSPGALASLRAAAPTSPRSGRGVVG